MHKTIKSKDISLKEVYNFMISGISPRPIAFVSSQDIDGNDNLAPFSYFNAFGSNPPIIGFSPANSGRTGKQKDTLLNIKDTKEFSVSIVNHKMVEQMSLSSCEYDRSIDEFIKSGFTKKDTELINVPGVYESPFVMECELYDIIELGGRKGSGNLILGEIVCFHISKSILDNEGKISPEKLDPVARLGFDYYSRPKDSLFQIFKPKHNGIGFDCLPKIIKESKLLTGNQLAKLAGVNIIPSKTDKYLDIEGKDFNQLYKIIHESLEINDINKAWQAVIRIVDKNGE